MDLVVGDAASRCREACRTRNLPAASTRPRCSASPHAAHGLVAVAAAAIAVSHRGRAAGRRARPTGVPGGPGSRVAVDTLGRRAPGRDRCGPATPPRRGSPGRARRLHVYSGADRADVVAALDAGRESTHGPARLVMVVEGRRRRPGSSPRPAAG